MSRFFPPAERDVKQDVKEYLTRLGAWWFMPVNRGRKGIPDFIVCYRSRMIGIETKKPRKKGTVKADPHQERELKAIRKAGEYTLVVSDVAPVIEFFKMLDWIQTRVAKDVVRPEPEPAVLRDGPF